MIKYKIDVLAALAAAGWTQTKLLACKVLGGSTLERLRRGEAVSFAALATICGLLGVQPGDVIYYDGGADGDDRSV